MTQRQLEIFVTLAVTLNFTRTSEYLFLSQTTVTLQIKNLEEELGVKLFERTSRSVHLTAAGKTLLKDAVPVLKQMKEMAEKARNIGKGYTGLLEIGFATEANATGMADLMDRFAEAHPEIRFRLSGGYPGDLMDGLVKRQYDIIFGPAFENIRSESFNSYVIGRYDLVAAFRKDHRFAKKKQVSCEDFEGEKLIYLNSPDLRLDFTNQFARRMEEKKVHAEVVASIDDIESVLIMMEAGQGITVLPEYFKGRFHGNSGLRTCKISENLKGVAYSAMWRKGKSSKELDLFLQAIKATFGFWNISTISSGGPPMDS